ncbi:hypothetical protein YUYDRAFT_07300 [Streptomyces sp. ScaeMP-e48]|jgi:hypothetical protein|uniref:Transposase n=1 Tax=Streptomyces microflavus DSM 40593 TaxID=1303692 RepID=N0D0M5_STRMI|nr:Putative transposase [Streptomyces microflavus DSM 40593]SCK55202.1 hypothetical protein YUYDRAFT_07300 [Streptomyces sp. ScaeMP-e48]
MGCPEGGAAGHRAGGNVIRTLQLRRFLSDTPLRRRIVRRQVGPEDLAHISPYLTEHINRFGEFSTHKLGIHPAAYGPKADLAGEPAPTGPARPGPMPPSFRRRNRRPGTTGVAG